MSPRIIRLRRPATLSLQEGVFVPELKSRAANKSTIVDQRSVLDEVDRRWEALRRSNPAYFDGRVLHVLGVHRNGHGGAVLHVMDCAYRFLAVQDDDFDLGVRALGVKGITMRDEEYLMGLRAPTVAFYREMWEFAPGGSVCPGDDPAQLIQQELHEETGLRASRDPVAAAVLFDPVLHCWELVFRLEAAAGEFVPHPPEYSQLAWRSRRDLPANLSPIARQVEAIL